MHGSRPCSIAHIHKQIDIKYFDVWKLFNFAECKTWQGPSEAEAYRQMK